jgi:hypothetical protein
MAGHIRARNVVLRRAQTGAHDPEDVGHPVHGVPDICVDRRRADPDQHLVILGLRPVDLPELEEVG